LDMDGFPDGRKLDVEGSAFSGRRAHIDFTGMFFDDSVADGEAQTGAAAAGFGGEKWIEDAMDVFAGNARAGIGNFDFHAAVVSRRANFQHSTAGHGVSRVEEQIQKHLLQLVSRASDGRKRFAELLYYLNLRALERMRHQRERFLEHLV